MTRLNRSQTHNHTSTFSIGIYFKMFPFTPAILFCMYTLLWFTRRCHAYHRSTLTLVNCWRFHFFFTVISNFGIVRNNKLPTQTFTALKIFFFWMWNWLIFKIWCLHFLFFSLCGFFEYKKLRIVFKLFNFLKLKDYI